VLFPFFFILQPATKMAGLAVKTRYILLRILSTLLVITVFSGFVAQFFDNDWELVLVQSTFATLALLASVASCVASWLRSGSASPIMLLVSVVLCACVIFAFPITARTVRS